MGVRAGPQTETNTQMRHEYENRQGEHVKTMQVQKVSDTCVWEAIPLLVLGGREATSWALWLDAVKTGKAKMPNSYQQRQKNNWSYVRALITYALKSSA